MKTVVHENLAHIEKNITFILRPIKSESVIYEFILI